MRRRAFEEIKGIHTWNLIVVIPLKLMGLDPSNLPEKILGNFYKCADETMNPHFVSWSPIDLPEPNFHCPEFFWLIYLLYRRSVLHAARYVYTGKPMAIYDSCRVSAQ